MQYIFDACTIINLIKIDEDEFLLKSIKKISPDICKYVFNEAYSNCNIQHRNTELKFNYFRERIYYPEDYLELKTEIAKRTNYQKNNGELYSVVLSYYLSQYESLEVSFHTDDKPAIDHFYSHFMKDKVGVIGDTIDFLKIIKECNSNFTSSNLKRFLSNLFSEYSAIISAIEKDINSLEIPKTHIRNKEFRIILEATRKSLKTLNINELYKLQNKIISNKKDLKPLFHIFYKHRYFFREKISNDYLDKLSETISTIR